MDKHVEDLEKAKPGEVTFIGTQNNSTVQIDLITLAENLWNKMYIAARKVIITCSHCHSANAITNSNCISCGAPLGKDIQSLGDQS